LSKHLAQIEGAEKYKAKNNFHRDEYLVD